MKAKLIKNITEYDEYSAHTVPAGTIGKIEVALCPKIKWYDEENKPYTFMATNEFFFTPDYFSENDQALLVTKDHFIVIEE